MLSITRLAIILSLAILPVTGSVASPYSEELTKCLIDSTSQKDRNQLMTWVFSAISQHPTLNSLANVSHAQLDSSNKRMAFLATRLITEDCRAETRQAIKVDGVSALENGFKLLGQIAAREMFNSPEVGKVMAGYESYLDLSKFEGLIE